jgi:hypothetical protein
MIMQGVFKRGVAAHDLSREVPKGGAAAVR